MEDKKVQLKKVFEVEEKISPFYTGGLISISKDHKTLYCLYNNSEINIVDIETSQIKETISPVIHTKNKMKHRKKRIGFLSNHFLTIFFFFFNLF